MDTNRLNLTIIFFMFLAIISISIGYSALNVNLTISGTAIVQVPTTVKLSNIILKEQLNGATEVYNSNFTDSSSNIKINLPNLNSSITYTITVLNETENVYYFSNINELINSNPAISYEIVDKNSIVFAPNSETQFDITFSYKDALTPDNELTLSLEFSFSEKYEEEILNGAVPVLNNGLIPVTIASDGTVSVADTKIEWYSYANKNWANAVLVQNPAIAYEVGDAIPMDNIKQMYVWIPRYSYDPASIENEYNAIDITFVNNESAAHPAFTFGTDELNGFWVGKFETGYEFGEVMTDTELHYSVKPNVYSIGPIDIYTMYQAVIKTNNNYGLDSGSDLHIIKNTEWGAVTYITHSIYGICTSDTNCPTMTNNYYANKVNDIITGCGGSTKPIIAEDVFDISICPSDYRWNTVNGYKASSTSNISGIYDLAAGKYEYVMTFMENPLGGVYTASSKFTQSNLPDSKYYDLYSENTNNKNSNGIIGDGILEIKDPTSTYSWNADYALFHTISAPFIVRSARVGSWHYAGMFAYYGVTGTSSGGVGAFATRNVIAPI